MRFIHRISRIMRQTRNQKRRKLRGNDYISLMPDDILLCILSKLNIKEQARTSILSSRWANLWTFSTTGINIDASDFFDIFELIQDEMNSEMKTHKFINTADQIISMHRGQTLDELKITYPIGTSETPDDHLKVDGWINIAKQKQVKALHLNFQPHRKNHFPLLTIGSTTLSSLITLCLEFASLSDHIIHCLLSNCPNLLELSIISTYGHLQHLKISGSSIKLKHLKLIDNDMDFLEIFAPNLVSFRFSTKGVKGSPIIHFKNVQLLTQLSCYHVLTLHTRSDYFVLLPQLETLTLKLSDFSDIDVIPHFPALKHLKQMHVALFGNRGAADLCLFLGLFKASPSLCGLSLDLGSREFPPLNHEFIEEHVDHKFVKEVEIDNFGGSNDEVQLVLYLARSCPSLQKIIIHPSCGKIKNLLDGIDYITQECVESAVIELSSGLPQKELEIFLLPTNDPNIFE